MSDAADLPVVAHDLAGERHRINLSWLLQLRWGASAGQVATILIVSAVGMMRLPVALLLGIVALEVASNVACALWARRAPRIGDASLGLVLVFDVLSLTALLHFSGGPFNPFCFLYLVHIALAAVILRERWTWALTALSVGCLGALFAGDVLGAEVDHATHMQRMSMHMEGMWVAMVVAATFIVYFVTRITRALAAGERELAAARERTARQEKLASLAALAAGAAHELSTPLSTIAVVAKELEHRLASVDAEAVEDVLLIRGEVGRCRSILDHMAADAGQSSGETSVPQPVGRLVEDALEGLLDPGRVRVELAEAEAAQRVHVPPRGASQALRVVIKNAMDACAAGGVVRVRATAEADAVRVAIEDDGEGMPPEVLARVGEPFFTTKGPGAGMGLGMFLTRAVVERIGGSVAIRSARGQGTTVTVTFPRRAPARASSEGTPAGA
jgi:two-component system sensor histidine kinase RegB